MLGNSRELSIAFGRKFNRLPTEFPSRLNRENLQAIREPKKHNSEFDPNFAGLKHGDGDAFFEHVARRTSIGR